MYQPYTDNVTRPPSSTESADLGRKSADFERASVDREREEEARKIAEFEREHFGGGDDDDNDNDEGIHAFGYSYCTVKKLFWLVRACVGAIGGI